MAINKVHTFDINDEPFVEKSTGVRQATLTYKGPKYIYAEFQISTGKLMSPVHAADVEEDEIAAERDTPDDDFQIVKINGLENPRAAAVVWKTHYTLDIPKYTETLPNGDTYEHDYGEDPNMDDIYDLRNMVWDFDANDFNWIYDLNDISDEEFIETCDTMLSDLDADIEENDYNADQMAKINEFKAKIQDIKDSYDGSVKHWKFEFPVLEL